jgi:putative heme-binding domain-containing protein
MMRFSFRAVCNALFFIVLLCACKNGSKEKENAPVAESEEGTGGTDKFADNIRKTDFQSPEDERKSFKLPPGFEVTLFASEPDISKPINMEFDLRGRLWVTTTIEYPKPAAPGRGRDKIVILEDTNGDGKADKFTPFVDSLNIPIGITPVHNGAIGYSIPNVYKFIDTNGDDKADETTKLLGPFAFDDTHGMVNNLVRGYDGWVYACHGYANNSTVAGSDGDSIHMISGNTFRFREDGSRAEITTHGRINPFGYAYDDWGYLYSLDCHTKPIYQLIGGAQYPAQGIKEPTIGWAPTMMSYEFGSTANSGLVYYTGTQFPKEFQHNFYSGNVVTSRVNRNTMILHGSSPESKQEEDFLKSDDPWFRPVDLKMGPDGSLYIADFYNRIIGHYEVPKDHPGRDKTSGRIWKITYTGNKKEKRFTPKDWSKAPLDELLAALGQPQVNMRMMLADCIVDRFGQKAAAPVQQLLATTADSKALIQGLWILYRLQALPEALLEKALQHSDPLVQVHGLRVLGEQKNVTAKQRTLVQNALASSNTQVQRMATMVLGTFPHFGYIEPLIALYKSTADEDSHLKYTVVLSLKNHLNNTAILREATKHRWREDQLAVLMDVIPEVPSKEAAFYAINYLRTHPVSKKKMADNLLYIGRYANASQLNQLIGVARQSAGGDKDSEYGFYDAIRQGIAQRGGVPGISLKNWGVLLAKGFLQNVQDSAYRQIAAAKIVVDYKVTALEPALKKLLTTKSADAKARIAAADALMTLSPQQHLNEVSAVFADNKETPELRERLSATLGQVQTPATLALFENTLNGAPRTLQVSVATILAKSPDGINYLLRALKAGTFKPDILEEFWVKEHLTATINPSQRKQLSALTAGKMGGENRNDLIQARLESFNPDAVTVEGGRQVFVNNCSMCHAIGNTGGNIGPKLSGIGTWGVNALAHKILDPNANISEAFRLYTITLKSGKTMSGLYRRDEGAVEVFADFSGQEFSVPKADISQKTPSKHTLMPDHFRNTIPKKDFDALLKYLVSVK